MIALLIPIFTRWGFTQRLAKIAAWAMVVVAAAILIGGGWAIWLRNHDQNTIKSHEAQISADVEQKQTAGSKAGQEAAADVKAEIEQENDDARKAAEQSDDPLADALRKLRR